MDAERMDGSSPGPSTSQSQNNKSGNKWEFLQHKGPVFSPPYEQLPDSVKFYYNGKEMKLSQDAEEVATFYARLLDSDYTTKELFNSNFFHDWQEVMTESESTKIVDLGKCDFREMHAHLTRKLSEEEKARIKEQKVEIEEEYGYCIIDGDKEKILNCKVEPPGLFEGRGEHPNMGKVKKRVLPEDVIINCSKDSEIPKAPEGRKWKEVRHDPSVVWLASWTGNIQGKQKYIVLDPSSKIRSQGEKEKYDRARKLAQLIDGIRGEYRKDWENTDMRIRQRAVALYFIDKLALRIGNEQGEDEADTVGCCSLRVEHITLPEQKDEEQYFVVFDFLGKDSVRYYNEVPVERRVFENLRNFKEGKSPGDALFDKLKTTDVNNYLNEKMEGLSAKVFRTYNASIMMQQKLDELANWNNDVNERKIAYEIANRAVGKLCNHRRSVPKSHARSMQVLSAEIDVTKQEIDEAESRMDKATLDARNGTMKGKSDYEQKQEALEGLREKLKKLEFRETEMEENKDIALITSKMYYIDPRITVAWCNKYRVPIEEVFTERQLEKFKWAIDEVGKSSEFIFDRPTHSGVFVPESYRIQLP